MVSLGIVLGHSVSERGTDMDTTNINAIEKFQNPTCIRDIRSFLGHVFLQKFY